MKQLFIALLFLSAVSGQTHAQNRSPFKTIAHTEYTKHSELFAEFRPLFVNTQGRFTAHLTHLGMPFKPYADAEVTLTLTINGKAAWEQTLTKPESPGIYRFPVKASAAGKGEVTISVKTTDHNDKLVVSNITVYADTATALAAQKQLPAEPEGLITYIKEKSWKEDFATAVVTVKGKTVSVPKTALVTDNGQTYVYLQFDPEHFKKQAVTPGKATGDQVMITSGLSANDRIVVLGTDKVR